MFKLIPLSELKPYEKNSRVHPPMQIKQITQSIKGFGFLTPVLISSDNTIIAGHGRVEAAKQLKLNEVPCIEVRHLTGSQIKAYVITDNKLALNSTWDEKILSEELEDLFKEGFATDLLGFSGSEFTAFFKETQEAIQIDEDDVPEENEVTIVQPGDIWLLDNHRLMCGDSTNLDHVAMLMNDLKADMVFTDPPYNTGMSAEKNAGGRGGTLWRGKKENVVPGKKKLSHMFNDDYTPEQWLAFIEDFCTSLDSAVKDDCFLFVCLDWRRSFELVPALKKLWHFSNLIVWDKVVHGMGSDYKYTHELIHVCKKGKPKLAKNKQGFFEYQDVWRIQRKTVADKDHATKKPVELVERAIKHASNPGDVVLDLFASSGTTLIACEKTGRSCYTMELSAQYCDTVIRRWQNYTKKRAVNALTGEIYQEVPNNDKAA